MSNNDKLTRLNPKINRLLLDFNNQLSFLESEMDDVVERSEKGIQIALIAVNQLKEITSKKNFFSSEEEIHFFKNIKPQFTSKLIYYNAIYKFESKKPRGGKKVQKKYIQNELDKLKRYFVNNSDFYKYYTRKNCSLDHKYFTRRNFDIKLDVDSYYFETDHTFSTTHDFKVAKILAHDKIEHYLENELSKTEKALQLKKSQHEPNTKIVWTAPKTHLVELLFALHSEGTFNNGAAKMKEIAEYFQEVFNIDLGQYRRAFLEIKGRKSDHTRFLDALKKSIIQKMESSEE